MEKIYKSILLGLLDCPLECRLYFISGPVNDISHRLSLSHFAISSTTLQVLMARLSGLQRDVLRLYRVLLRESKRKDSALSSTSGGESSSRMFQDAVRQQMRLNAETIPKTNFTKIEFLIRKGKKQLELIKDPNVTSFSFVPLLN